MLSSCFLSFFDRSKESSFQHTLTLLIRHTERQLYYTSTKHTHTHARTHARTHTSLSCDTFILKLVPLFTCLPLLNDCANYKTTFDIGCERCCMHAMLDSCVQDSFTAVCITCPACHPSPCAVPVYISSLTSPQLSCRFFVLILWCADLQAQNGFELIGSTPLLRTFVCNNKPSMSLSSLLPPPSPPPPPHLFPTSLLSSP